MNVDESIYSSAFWSEREDDVSINQKAPKRIKSIQMHTLSDADVRKLSVLEVTGVALYDKLVPKPNSLNDKRLGTCDVKERCKRCYNDIIKCAGHFGHIEFPMPIYHIAYIGVLVKLLRSICHNCNRLILLDDNPFLLQAQKFPPKLRFQSLTKHAKTKRKCAHCACSLPSVKRTGFAIRCEWSKHNIKHLIPFPHLHPGITKTQLEKLAGKHPFAYIMKPQTVQNIMRQTNIQSFVLLGLRPDLSHPANFIMHTLLVPPVIVRPAITFAASAKTRGQDDLTNRLLEIQKTAIKLRKLVADKKLLEEQISQHDHTKPDPKHRSQKLLFELQQQEIKIQTQFDFLQNQCSTYFNNESSSGKSQSKKRSGLPEKSVMQRLKGKKGRFRGNLTGKRVDFSARSPISPDPNIRIDQIGVMDNIARVLTYPEYVNKLNRSYWQKRVNLGFHHNRGAHSIINNERHVISLAHCPNIPILEPGNIVHRYMQDDDVILFNRQPSLRKKSIMAHRVKLMPGKTFRLSLPATTPYNADCDGNARERKRKKNGGKKTKKQKKEQRESKEEEKHPCLFLFLFIVWSSPKCR
jgi:DNA-directed RNA polymerase II subunit RPB1